MKMFLPKFEFSLVPGDKANVVHCGDRVLELSSNHYCKVTVELLPSPFDSLKKRLSSDWSSIKACEHKPKPVEEL